MPFGGTVALTLMSTAFNNKSGAQHVDAKKGVKFAFVALVPFVLVCLVLTTFLGNVWIGKDGGHDVVNGACLWSFASRKRLVKGRRTRGDAVMRTAAS